jgi:hypothetical protein
MLNSEVKIFAKFFFGPLHVEPKRNCFFYGVVSDNFEVQVIPCDNRRRGSGKIINDKAGRLAWGGG